MINITKPKNLIIGFLILIIVYMIISNSSRDITSQKIANLTNLWIKRVTIDNDAQAAFDMFCPDGSLIATVSKTKRLANDIKLYFNFFVNIPGIKVLSKKYYITNVTNNVYINTAFVTWKWDDLDKPIVARMTFIFRDNCIFQLHSSVLPDLNDDLYRISGNM